MNELLDAQKLALQFFPGDNHVIRAMVRSVIVVADCHSIRWMAPKHVRLANIRHLVSLTPQQDASLDDLCELVRTGRFEL